MKEFIIRIAIKYNGHIEKILIFFIHLAIKPLLLIRKFNFVINKLRKIQLGINKKTNYENFIKNILTEKIVTLDVGSSGGFNSDSFFLKSYEKFFKIILVEPIDNEIKKIKKKHYYDLIITDALWSSNITKKIYFTGKNPSGSSMYKPNKDKFRLYTNSEKYFELYEITDMINVNCSTLEEALHNLNINILDYLKIDTQGSEYEIIKGMGNFRPLLVKLEAQILPLYDDVPNWGRLLEEMDNLGYMGCEWDKDDSHVTHCPVEMEMLFVPNYLIESGKNIISGREEKFISLMLMFGQISILKIISDKLNFKQNLQVQNLKDLFHK